MTTRLPTKASEFVHLHVHSNFSFLDGATPPERMVKRAAELGMKAMALTDHNGLYGAVRFMQAAEAHGIRPIVGVEVEVEQTISGEGVRQQGSWEKPVIPAGRRGQSRRAERGDKVSPGASGEKIGPRFHLTLLAKNRKGYASLCRIVSKAQLDHQDDPHISLDNLASFAGNIMALSGCARGEVIAALPQRNSSDLSGAVHVARKYAGIFGEGNFWIELQHHLLPGDDLRNAQLVEVAKRAGLGYVITNNVHYAEREEYRLRDVMACIQTNTRLDEWTDVRQRNAEYYLKPAHHLAKAFRALSEDVVRRGLAASGEIAARCRLTGPEGSLLATYTRPPVFEVPRGETAFSYLYALCNEGLRKKFQPLTGAAVDRLAYELKVVEQMDLAEFFLCVWDIVCFSKSKGIRCAGRGSAADSIIAYVLDITTVDPLANNLLFDRFLNPGRVGMPDVDIDFCSRRRDEVIAYIENKYGPEHSAMVANLVTYRSRSAFRDVAKAMGYPPGLIDQIASSLSFRSVQRIREDLRASGIRVEPSASSAQAEPDGVEFLPKKAERSRRPDDVPREPVEEGDGRESWDGVPATVVESFGQLETIIELCERLDGYPRHLSLHNGGMLITREPLVDIVPIEYATSGVRVCQFNKDDVEALGLIKFDILGLRTLSIVDEAVAMLNETRGFDLPIDDLPLDDKAVYDFICTSKTIGVFQIESPGQWHLLQRAQPRTFGDLIIQIALFRPGPLQGGMVNPYIERRCGREAVTYMHPSLEEALRDTLGVVIFQEQVMQVAHDFAGLSYADADGLRRAMSHYRTDAEMDVCREDFVESAVRLGRDRAMAEEMYHKLTYFSGYGFCRSHAAAFAKTVYQTAFLKTYFPAELLAGILSNEPCCYYPTQTVIEEARKWGIEVLPVDVNRSRARYRIELPAGGSPRSARATQKVGDTLRQRMWNADPGAIRMGLLQVKGVSEDAAESIVECRRSAPFRSLEDFWRRTSVDRNAVHNLIAVGAFDGLGISRRKLMWHLDEVVRKTPRLRHVGDVPRVERVVDGDVVAKSSSTQAAKAAGPVLKLQTVHLDLSGEEAPEPLPEFPPLTDLDLAGLDMSMQNASARYSVMSFYRRSLKAAKVMSIGEVEQKPHGLVLKTAGIVISRQQPPTANGMTFLVLSDEEGELPAAVPPHVYSRYRRTLAASASLVVEGTLQRHRRYVSLMVKRMWNLREVAELDPMPSADRDPSRPYSRVQSA